VTSTDDPTATATAPHYAFVFVCQAGELEIKALLLAASLKRHLSCAHELIAAVPSPAQTWGEISAATRQLLQQFGASIVPIVNPIDPTYPIGNKLACIDVPTRARKIVFLDSDILCLRDLGFPACLQTPFAAKPADLRTFAAHEEAWRPLYAATDVPMPQLRLPTTVSGEFGLPYFNSGVICVDSGLHFGAAWIDCARTLRNAATMRDQRHWLDQVSLPIAMGRLGLSFAALDEQFNFPAHLKPLPTRPPIFCHYHWPRIVREEPLLHRLVCDLAREHPAIGHAIAAHAEWNALLESAPATHVAPAPELPVASTDLLVIGIPDSGVEQLTGCLGSQAGVGVIAMAADALATQTRDSTAWEFSALLRRLRTQQPENPRAHDGLRGGSSGKLVVAGAGAAGLLSALQALERVAPQTRRIVCVRDPFATIAAWKQRPLAEIDAAIAQTLELGERRLARRELDVLQRVAALQDPAEKRATWWWWLAQRVLDLGDRVIRVRYAEFCTDPSRVLQSILGAEASIHLPARSEIRPDDESSLTDDDRQAIRAVCLQAAWELGLTD